MYSLEFHSLTLVLGSIFKEKWRTSFDSILATAHMSAKRNYDVICIYNNPTPVYFSTLYMITGQWTSVNASAILNLKQPWKGKSQPFAELYFPRLPIFQQNPDHILVDITTISIKKTRHSHVTPSILCYARPASISNQDGGRKKKI